MKPIIDRDEKGHITHKRLSDEDERWYDYDADGLDLKSISSTVATRTHITPGEAMSYVGDAWGKLDRRFPLNMQAEYLIRCAMGYALNEYARNPDIIDDIGRVPDESAPDEDDEAFVGSFADEWTRLAVRWIISRRRWKKPLNERTLAWYLNGLRCPGSARVARRVYAEIVDFSKKV